MRLRHFFPISAIALIGLGAMPLLAQTSDDFYDPSVLQDVRITMDPNDWNTLKQNFRLDTVYPASFQWRGVTVNNVGIRSHGTGSRNGIKPALFLNIDYFNKGQLFLGMKGTILKNSAQDSSMLRDRLTMQIWRRLGLPSPRVNSARVFMNGDYIGVFENFENVDDVYVQRWFNESTGYLSKFSPFPSGPWATGYHFEYLGDNLDDYAPIPYQPETHQNAPDTVSLEALVRTINQEPDSTFASAAAAYLDLKKVAHYMATEDYMGEWDGFLGDIFGMNNFYLYRYARQQQPLFELLAHDEKDTFTKVDRELFHNSSLNVLTRRLLTLPDFRTTWLEGVMKINTIVSGPNSWLDQEITREYNQIKDAVYADPNRLVDNGGVFTVMTTDIFEGQINGLHDWVRQRVPTVSAGAAAAGFKLNPAGPKLNTGGIINAASNTGAVLAPGSLVSAYGAQFAGTVAQTPSVHLPTTMAGLTVFINGFQAPLLLVSAGQVNFQIPWEVGPGPATVTMVGNGPLGILGNTITVNIGPFSPGIFKVTHADLTTVDASSPATGGEVLILWGTGLGPTSPAVPTGEPPTGAPATTTTPTVTLAGASAAVQFSGISSFAGLYQVNVQLPATVPTGGSTPLVLAIGGQSTTVPLATR
jgi:uncharacterized protein (TIGR03437 family)